MSRDWFSRLSPAGRVGFVITAIIVLELLVIGAFFLFGAGS